MVADAAPDSDPATHGDLDSLRVELRGDIDRLGTELRGDIDRLRNDIDRLAAELRGDIERLRLELRGDIAHAMNQQTWRMLGLGVAVAAIIAAVLRLT